MSETISSSVHMILSPKPPPKIKKQYIFFHITLEMLQVSQNIATCTILLKLWWLSDPLVVLFIELLIKKHIHYYISNLVIVMLPLEECFLILVMVSQLPAPLPSPSWEAQGWKDWGSNIDSTSVQTDTTCEENHATYPQPMVHYL